MARLAGSLALGLLAAVGAAWAQDADRLYDLAEQAFSEARYDDALADYSASHRAARGERRVTVAEIIGLRGSDLAKRVDLFTAERFLERSIELLAEGPAVSRAELLILLGNVQETLGHAERAANSIDAAMVLSQPFEGTAQCETWLRAQLAHGGHRLRRRAYSDV
jgi:ATP/maltotriose-dependent transcriptional regulator MalT